MPAGIIKNGQLRTSRPTPSETGGDQHGHNANFSSWRFDVINAANIDTDLTEAARRVLVELVQHANQETRLIFPTEERLATLLSINVRSLRRAVALLKEKGWIAVERTDKSKSNLYRIKGDRVKALLEERGSRAKIARELRVARSRLRQQGEDADVLWLEDEGDLSDRTVVSS